MADRQDRRQMRLNWRRVGIVGGALLAIITWGRPMVEPLVRGWYNSCHVLDARAEIEALEQQRAELTDERDYALTDEGRDVEARRQFDVGPPEDVRIVIRAKGSDAPPPPTGLGERFTSGMNRVGGAWTRAFRRVRDVLKYWWGLDPVPATDLPATDAPDEATAR